MNITNQIVQVRVEDIIPNKYQPRLIFNDQDIGELADSIKQYGIIQPLTLRPFDAKYEIIAGERRYKAAKLLGMETVPAIIMNINDQTSAEIALVENIQRKNLNAIEEAKAYKKILEIENITQEELAKKIGKTQTTISNKIRLLDLVPEVQDAVLNNQISERHARTILQLNNFESQKEVLQKIITNKLTVKLTEELIQNNYKSSINNKDNLQSIFNIGDDNKMNEQNYNTLNNQPAGIIPETPLPQAQPPQQEVQTQNNNFFPSLEDEKTNMELNPWSAPTENNNGQQAPTQEPLTMPGAAPQENNVNPWDMPSNGAEQSIPVAPTQDNLQVNIPAAPETSNLNMNTNNAPFDLNNNFSQTPQGNNEFNQPQPVSPNLDFNQVPNNDIQVPGATPLDTNNMSSNLNPVEAPQNPFTQPDQVIAPLQPEVTMPQPTGNPLPGFIDQQSFNQPVSNPVPNNNVNELVPLVRKAISEIDPTGTKLQMSELDLDNEYQITIKIQKGSN